MSFVCVVLGEQGGSFLCRLMLEKLGNGMKERELQKCKIAQVKNWPAVRRLPGGHLAASRPLAVSIPEPCFLSGEAQLTGGHLAASRVMYCFIEI